MEESRNNKTGNFWLSLHGAVSSNRKNTSIYFCGWPNLPIPEKHLILFPYFKLSWILTVGCVNSFPSMQSEFQYFNCFWHRNTIQVERPPLMKSTHSGCIFWEPESNSSWDFSASNWDLKRRWKFRFSVTALSLFHIDFCRTPHNGMNTFNLNNAVRRWAPRTWFCRMRDCVSSNLVFRSRRINYGSENGSLGRCFQCQPAARRATDTGCAAKRHYFKSAGE
jgi:hypothetical protein